MGNDDRRQHGRIQHVMSAILELPQGKLPAELQSISKGGAAVTSPSLKATLQDALTLIINYASGQTLKLKSKIIWIRAEDNPPAVGLRFEDLSTEDEHQLQHLIKQFLNEGSKGGRRHPRIARRVPARYGETDELKAMLENISLGGLALIVDTPVKPKDQVEIEIQNPDGPPPLVVNGIVVYCHPAGQTGRDVYRVGIEFKDLSEATQASIKRLQNSLLETS